MRRFTLLSLALALALPAAASAGELEAKIRLKLKKYERRSRDRVIFRLVISRATFARLRRERAKIRVNFYGGRSTDETRKFKSVTWKLRRKKKKWPSFSKRWLCRKGFRVVRVKVKVKSAGESYDTRKKLLELACN